MKILTYALKESIYSLFISFLPPYSGGGGEFGFFKIYFYFILLFI